MAMPQLEIKRRNGAWEILGDSDAGPMGPYTKRTDAEADKRGVLRFYKHENSRAFFTGERK